MDGGVLGFVPFKLYPFQIEVARLIERQNLMAFKVRQIGLTLTCSVYCLYRAIKYKEKTLIISKTGSDSSEVVKDLRRLLYSNPEYKSLLITDNLTDLEFSTGGRIKAVAPVADSAGRSLKSVRYLILDEAQSIPELSSVKSAASATQTTWADQARTIILGTPPEIRANDYWELFSSSNGDIDPEERAEEIRQGDLEPFDYWEDDGGWAKCLIHWKADPTKAANPNYLEDTQKRQKLDSDQLQREHNLKIPSDQETALFSAELVNGCLLGEDLDPYEEGQAIYFGIDTAWQGGDYFVVIVLRKRHSHFEVLDMYRDHLRTLESYLAHTIQLVKQYSPLTIRVETNNGGDSVFQRLSTLSPEAAEKGFTSEASKPGLISRLKLALEMGHLRVPKGPITKELLNFVRKPNGKLEAFRGNDDCVLGLAHAIAGSQYDGSDFDRPSLLRQASEEFMQEFLSGD